MRTGFIDDLRNCKQCGSLEHKNYLRNDLCPNCYYDVDRFKEEREKTKADNKWLNKWQKLKEWLEYRTAENGVFDNYDSLAVEDNLILDKMQELEAEDEEN